MAMASTTGASPHKTPRSRDRNHTQSQENPLLFNDSGFPKVPSD